MEGTLIIKLDNYFGTFYKNIYLSLDEEGIKLKEKKGGSKTFCKFKVGELLLQLGMSRKFSYCIMTCYYNRASAISFATSFQSICNF